MKHVDGRWVALGIVCVAVAAVAAWRAGPTEAVAADAPPAAVATATAHNTTDAARPVALAAPVPHAAAMPASAAAAATPPGVSAATWAHLQIELRDQPAELQRLASYYAYTDALQHFRSLRRDPQASPAQLAQLATTLDQGVDAHLQRNELSAPEARLVKMAALEVLVPDETQRAQQLAQWTAQTAQAEDAADQATVAPTLAREAAFRQQQAQLVAAWQALPAAQRDPKQLDQQLAALRQQVFEGAGS